ncbi:unnamed protein product [Penicillium pancosmium]
MSEQYFFSMSEHFIACTEMVAQMARFMNVLNSASLLPPESRPALDSLALIIAARSQQQLVNMRQMIHLPQEVTWREWRSSLLILFRNDAM